MTPGAVMDWAQSVHDDLAHLQTATGIPALWAASQMCHEAFNPDGSLSDLAASCNNYAGLKWADWQAQYGCKPVTYGTWEVVDGQAVSTADAFCRCPDWSTWLRVYGALLTGEHYGPALAYAADPLLYGAEIWRRGWATDPAYLAGVSGWMARLWPIYQDTLPRTGKPDIAAGPRLIKPVPITDRTFDPPMQYRCMGWLSADGVTYAPIRAIAQSFGGSVVPVSAPDGTLTEVELKHTPT